MPTQNKIDIMLFERPGEKGLTFAEIIRLCKSMKAYCAKPDTQVHPIELEAKQVESSAMGFITADAADTLNYDYETSGLHDYIASILDDVTLENDTHVYQFKGINIFMTR